MRKSFVSLLSLALFLGVLLSLGCGGGSGGGGASSPTAPTADGSLADLNGTVTYLGKPVPNAAVYLLKVTAQQNELSRRVSVLAQPEPDFSVLTADGNGYKTTSDANGAYSFTQVPVGTYTLDASISPTIRVSQSVVLGAISNLDLALKPTGSISGKVTLDGSPVQAMVFLQGTSYIGITDLSGSFTIMNVPVETTPYTLIPVVPSTSYPASMRISVTGAGSGNEAPASQQPQTSLVQGSVLAVPYGAIYTFKNSPVQVTPIAGTNTDLGTLELVAAMGTLTGTAQIEGATMHSGIYVSTSGSSAYTDSEGKYTLENVYFGQRTVNFSKYYGSENYTGSTVVLVDSVATKTVSTVTLRPQSATMAKVDVSLIGLTGSGGSVYFYLYDSADPSSYLYYGYHSSPATSTYNLEPGTYYVRIEPGSNYTLLNPAAGETDLLESIAVTAGGNASFVARLQYNKANLTGTISGIDPNFPANYVYLNPGGYSAYVSGGSYSFSAIPPGAYTLSASTPGYTAYSSAITLVAGTNTRNFTLTPTFPTVSAVSYTAPTVSVTGTRFDTSSANLYIAPQSGGYSTYSATTRTATLLALDVSGFNPGAYTVKARGSDGAVSIGSGNFSKPFSTPPSVLTGVIGTGTYTMNWNSLPGATGYILYRGGTQITTTTGTSYTFTGLTPNTTYTFGVAAIGNGIANSTTNTVTVTTSRVFNAPVVYDSGVNIGNPVRSFMYDGYLYALGGNPGGPYTMLRYDLRNPSVGAAASLVLTDPNGSGSGLTDLHVDASGVFVGWRTATTIYIQKYNADLSPGVQNTYSAVLSGTAAGVKVTSNQNALVTGAALQAFSWNFAGVASMTYLTATLSPVATDSRSFISQAQGMEWTPITGSDGNTYLAMVLSTSGNKYYQVFDPSLTTLVASGTFSALPYNLNASPNRGFVWGCPDGIRFANPPGIFGTQVQGYQAAMDKNDRIYAITQNTDTITRYTPTGNPDDSISFPAGYAAANANRLIHYDKINRQIVVLTPAGTNLGVMIFGVTD